MSFIGVGVLILLAVLLSSNRRAIKLQTVGGAFLLQAGVGAFALYVPWGQTTLAAISNTVSSLQDYANEGISFLFGPLASEMMFEVFGHQGFVFAIKVLPLIVFFSSFIVKSIVNNGNAARISFDFQTVLNRLKVANSKGNFGWFYVQFIGNCNSGYNVGNIVCAQ